VLINSFMMTCLSYIMYTTMMPSAPYCKSRSVVMPVTVVPRVPRWCRWVPLLVAVHSFRLTVCR
jgi:hypothetical protein